MPTSKIVIIGAGTGGMCLAHGLRRAGFEVAVHERDRTRTGGLHGYRVGISPNGARALKACLDEDLFATFVATAAPGLRAPHDVHRALLRARRDVRAQYVPHATHAETGLVAIGASSWSSCTTTSTAGTGWACWRSAPRCGR
jgi:2-polyprenyl-6-methoxyphenol hydroxylase-like FAD-dependent oxidoreductase